MLYTNPPGTLRDEEHGIWDENTLDGINISL